MRLHIFILAATYTCGVSWVVKEMCPKFQQLISDVKVRGYCFKIQLVFSVEDIPLCGYDINVHQEEFFVARNKPNRCSPYKDRTLYCFCSSYFEDCARYVWSLLPLKWRKGCLSIIFIHELYERGLHELGTKPTKAPSRSPTITTRTKTKKTTTTTKTSTISSTTTTTKSSTYSASTGIVEENRSSSVEDTSTSTVKNTTFAYLSSTSTKGRTKGLGKGIIGELSSKERVLRDKRKKLLKHSSLLLLILSSIMVLALVLQLMALKELRKKVLSRHRSGVIMPDNRREKKSTRKGRKKNVIHHDEEEKNKQKDSTTDNDVTDLYAISRIGLMLQSRIKSKEKSREGETFSKDSKNTSDEAKKKTRAAKSGDS